MSEYTATIKLKADRSGLTGELKIAQADIAKLNDELQKTGADGAKGAEGIKKHGTEARGAARESEKLSKETKTLREQYLSLKNVLVGYGVLQIGRFFKDQLAAYQDTRTMLQGLTGSTQEYNETQAYLVDISERYSKQLNTVSGSYARLLALQNADLVTKKEARQLTEGLLNAGAALKANNEQLGLVYYGLAQGLSQVNLQAQELNQVMEPLPGLLVHMDAAAGLTSGGFRRMVMDGQVTSEFFKTTLIEALQVYEGAAEATYNNISSIQDRLATGHTLLAASLEEPINMSIGSLLRGYVVGVETLAKVMPTLIELIKDLVAVTAVLVGVKAAAWLYGIAAGSLAAIAGLFTLEARLYAGLRATSAYTVALTGLKGAMAFLGGPLGIAVLAGAALLTFGTNSSEAAMRTANLRSEIDQLAESFNELTVSQVDQQIQSQMLAMEELAKQKAALGERPVLATGSGNSNLGSVPNMASLNELRDWQAEAATIADGLEAGVTKLNALAIARGNAVTASLNAEALATEALTKTQQDLLDKYLPLETLTAEYTKNLAALNAIEVDSVATAARKQRAIDALNAVYEDQVKELTGVLAAEDEASKAAEKALQDMMRLVDQYAPLQNAVAVYETQLLTLTLAYETGRLSLENYHLAVAALAEEKLEAFQPGAALVRQMEAELKLMRMSAADQEFAKRTRHLTTLEIEEQGDAIRALIGAMSDEQSAIDALDARQQDYARTTQNMLEDLQRSWNSYFDQVLEKGKLNMRSLADSILAVMRQTIAGVMSMDLANAFRSTLNVTAPTATSAGSASVNWQSVGTLMGAGVAGVLNASIAQTVAPLYEGGQLISEGAKTLNFDLKNIGTNLLAGLAGGTIGTALGEAVFGKQAQSNYGAMAGAAIGSMLPGVGTFLGSLIGGGLDALFGGDGYQRSSVGFDTGRDMVKSQYYYGTETFSSGLQVNKINRRGDQAVSDAITAKFAEIDAFVFSAARGAGATLNMRNKQLQGTHADYGWDDGSFFGLRAGEGADAEEALNGLFTSFSRQLINHIEGLSADVTRAMQQATGDADALLAQLKDALALDSLLRSGQLDVLGDVSFDFAQQLAEAAGGIENLSMVTQLFNTSVAEQSDSMQNMVTRLRTAVSDQFAAMNLALNDFTSMSQFREYFESVKQTMDAVQLLDLLQAGNALALLIEQEKELALVRQQAMTEQISAVKDLVDQYQWIRTQSQAVAGALQNDIFKLSGVGATDLRSRLGSSPLNEQLDVVDLLRQQILLNYSEQLKLEQQLHEERLAQYDQQLDAAQRINDYIAQVMTGDLSPLSVADRLDLAQRQFDDVYARAMSGDLGAAQEVTGYFDAFARVNQQANASSDVGVAGFNTNMAKLQEVAQLLGTSSAPAALDTTSLVSATLAELAQLQGEVVRIQHAVGAEIVAELLDMNVIMKNLPKEIAAELNSLLRVTFGNSLQIGTNFGVLSGQIVTALGLLPTANDLSDAGIAAAIEAMTALSKHPFLFAESIGSLADAMGVMMHTMVNSGVAPQIVADQVLKNPVATEAANQYLQGAGLGQLSDYASPVNPNVSATEIQEALAQLEATLFTEKEIVDAVVAAALTAGVGSGQLSAATGYSQTEILQLAEKYGHVGYVNDPVGAVAQAQAAAVTAPVATQTPPPANVVTDPVVVQNPPAAIETEVAAVTAPVAQSAANRDKEITDFVNQVLKSAIEQYGTGTIDAERQAVLTVVQAAIDNNVSSSELARATGYTQADILSLASHYGMPSFAVGTDRVTHDGPAMIHQEEIIFDRPRSSRLRDAIVDQVESGSTTTATLQRFLQAVETQTQLLAELVDQTRALSAEQRVAFTGAAREMSQGMDRLIREVEDLAA